MNYMYTFYTFQYFNFFLLLASSFEIHSIQKISYNNISNKMKHPISIHSG